MDENKLLTSRECAKMLSTTISTLSSWRVMGDTTLPYVKVGKLVRYKLKDILAYIDKQTKGEF